MHGSGVLDGIEGSLSLRGATEFVIGFGQWNCANPGHIFGLPSARRFAYNAGVPTPNTQHPTGANGRKALCGNRAWPIRSLDREQKKRFEAMTYVLYRV